MEKSPEVFPKASTGTCPISWMIEVTLLSFWVLLTRLPSMRISSSAVIL